MRIAIIGSGVSGLGAAWALRDTCQIKVYESEPRLGGHACTVQTEHEGRVTDVDVGFIVYNEPQYPNFTQLLQALDVSARRTKMGFSVYEPGGIAWSSDPGGLMATWRDKLSARRWLMLAEMIRFSAQARWDLARGKLPDAPLSDYLKGMRAHPCVSADYIQPMSAAIWSSSEHDILSMPAPTLVRFFNNHRLLHIKRPQWRTIEGGSRAYVSRLAAAIAQVQGEDVFRLGAKVASVRRDADGVVVRDASGGEDRFDQVIFASHAPQALAMLSDADAAEHAALSAFRTSPNDVWLHRDPRFMPPSRKLWAAWNVYRHPGRREGEALCVSYWMNRLQSLEPGCDLIVTLNPPEEPDPDKTFARFSFSHPQFDQRAIQAQRSFNAVQGKNRVWFAGAWLGYGFHEDGLRAGLQVAERLGAKVPWTVGDGGVRNGDWAPPHPSLGAPMAGSDPMALQL